MPENISREFVYLKSKLNIFSKFSSNTKNENARRILDASVRV